LKAAEAAAEAAGEKDKLAAQLKAQKLKAEVEK